MLPLPGEKSVPWGVQVSQRLLTRGTIQQGPALGDNTMLSLHSRVHLAWNQLFGRCSGSQLMAVNAMSPTGLLIWALPPVFLPCCVHSVTIDVWCHQGLRLIVASCVHSEGCW